MHDFLRIRGIMLRGAGAALMLAALVARPASGQSQTVSACYVPAVGALYLIKFTGLPAACLSTDHVEISWREGVLADGAVTIAKLAFDPATQAELDALVAALKAAGTVNEAGNPVDWTKLKGVPAGFADGVDHTGGTSSDVDCTGCVATAELGDLAVTTAKLADAAVSTAKLADGALTSAKLATDAVGSAKITDGSVATADLADGAVATAKLANAAVTAAKLAADAGSAIDHGTLSGLSDDDHPRYLLVEGTRAGVNGFAVTGTFNSGTIPIQGAGVRLMWHPAKAAFRAGEVAGTQWNDASVGPYSTAVGFDANASGYASMAAGFMTTASNQGSVAMGQETTASGLNSTALGNGTNASGAGATAIGASTTASGQYSTAMGLLTTASGLASTAIGSRASTNSFAGTFVYGDNSTTSTLLAHADNSFVVRAQRVWLGTSGNQVATTGRYLETSTGAYLSDGGAWTNASAAERKENFQEEDAEAVLAKVVQLPVRSWNYRDEHPGIRHLGPTAQDFFAAFGLGDGDKAIGTVDAAGVALLAIQGLHQLVQELERRVAVLEQQNQALVQRLAKLEPLAPANR